ncbi:MAG: Lrp/AsnC ligand binding domain-containing protein [Methanobacteriota archaeon]|nr:MAG: Lrp/AsnC ligand binding domain-containing protein [Euryarchaeota archaeon]
MVKALMLILLEAKTFEEANKIVKIPGVRDGFLVFGHYDYAAFVEVPSLEKVSQIAEKVQKLRFVRYVETLIER